LQRVRTYDQRQWKRHLKNFHADKNISSTQNIALPDANQYPDANANDADADPVNFSSTASQDDTDAQPNQLLPAEGTLPLASFSFDRVASSEYFKRNVSAPFGGPAYLISTVLLKTGADAHLLPLKEISSHFDVLSHIVDLTKSQRSNFAICANHFFQQGYGDGYNQAIQDCKVALTLASTKDPSILASALEFLPPPRPSTFTNLPATPADIRTTYSNGLLKLLPHPAVFQCSDGLHSRVSLISCIQDALAHCLGLQDLTPMSNLDDHHSTTPKVQSIFILLCVYCPNTKPCFSTFLSHQPDNVSHIFESHRAVEIADNAFARFHNDSNSRYITLFLMEWSDDFEPNSGMKSNRGSMWTKTMTISPRPCDRNSSRHTYVLASGPKEVSHEIIEATLADELEKLRSDNNLIFFDGVSNSMVKVHAELFVSLQDQPERRSANYISLGNSTYSAQWCLASDFAAISQGVPSCPECLFKLLSLDPSCKSSMCLLPLQQCTCCLNWTANKDNPLSRFAPPPHFPEDQIPPHQYAGDPKLPFLVPSIVNHSSLMSAATLAHAQYISGNWTESNVKAYLRVSALNTEAIDSILNHAKYAKKTHNANDADLDDEVREHRSNFPHLYKQWPFPSLWNRKVDLSQHIDVVMHLIFLGVMKTWMRCTFDWLSERNKKESFLQFGSSVLPSIQQLNLEWCKIIPYSTDGLGGLVSENYLAMGRISKWFYCCGLPLCAPNPAIFNGPPNQSNVNQWTAAHCNKWLSDRSLRSCLPAKSTVGILRGKVKEGMLLDPSKIVFVRPAGGCISLVLKVVVSLHSMISTLMTTEVNNEILALVELRIKIFLTFFHQFDCALSPKKNKVKKKKKKATTPTPPTPTDTSTEQPTMPLVVAPSGVNQQPPASLLADPEKPPICKPKWLSSYNFLSLLNFPPTLQRFGPFRNLWEGSIQGEGILRQLKPEIHGRRVNFAFNFMLTFYQKRAVNLLQESLASFEETTDSAPVVAATSPNYHTYNGAGEIIANFICNKPISAVQLQDGHFYCASHQAGVCRGFGTIFLKLTKSSDGCETISNCPFHNFSAQHLQDANNMDDFVVSFCDASIINNCLFLPKMGKHGFLPTVVNAHCFYYVIDFNWKELSNEGMFCFPKPPSPPICDLLSTLNSEDINANYSNSSDDEHSGRFSDDCLPVDLG
jgi:hypothetical protein